MRVDELVAALRREGEDAVAALDRADPDAVVPTCTEWTVRELAQHLGRVHRWAATYVREGRAAMLTPDEEEAAWGALPADADLVGWLRDGHAALVDTLASAPADLACWSFLPAPSPLAFWARRQARETAIHRVDLQGAAGPVAAADPAFAADGVDELLTGFFSRPRNRVRVDESRTIAVRATDTGHGWLLRLGPDGARAESATDGAAVSATDGAAVSATDGATGGGPEGGPDAWLHGPAGALYYALWNRTAWLDLEVGGDLALWELWRSKATVRWS